MRVRSLFLVLVFSVTVACGGSPPDLAETTPDAAEVLADLAPLEVAEVLDGRTSEVDAADDVAEAPFGDPCLHDDDCEGHICLASFEGSFCTHACTGACPEGFACRALFLARPEVVTACVPTPPTLCARCQNDAECSGGPRLRGESPSGSDSRSVCVVSDEGGFCAADCSRWACPDTYHCQPLSHAPTGDDLQVCRPANGSCVCRPETAGQLRSCQQTSAAGTCFGVEACDGDGGWQGCNARVPAPEACNGQDDDCDTLIDEELPAGLSCENAVEGVGTCPGEQRCGGALGWVCDARAPAIEACNFQDDDCDGQTDEGFASRDAETGQLVYDTFSNCGSCGVDCTGAIANAASIRCDATLPFPLCVVDACAEPYFELNPFQCILPPFTFCNPCATDAECYGNSCLDLGAGRYCFRQCAAADDCQGVAGYACRDYPGEGGSWCLPDNGTCDCDADAEGFRKACSVSNALGTCFGFSTCQPAVGWTPCDAQAARPELCNGRDDDCDGATDEDLDDEPCSLTTEGVGTCWGTALCFGAAGRVCDAATPHVETCNGQDDDCDGQTDEDFLNADGEYGSDTNCGACDHACAGVVPNGTAMCGTIGASHRCVLDACDPGYVPFGDAACVKAGDGHCTACAADADCVVPGDRCLPSEDGTYCALDCGPDNLHGQPPGTCPAGFTCRPDDDVAPLGPAHCAPQSGSCTCTADEHGRLRICSVAAPAGTCFGARTCDAYAGWSECSAHVPVAETCNGVDDDCDGVVDDVAGVGEPCAVSVEGVGTCLGLRVCPADGAGPVCSARTPALEICNAKDDDCDGQTDEGFLSLGASCSVGVGACRRYGEIACAADGATTRCSADAGLAAPEVCNHLDDDCDGQTDEDWPALGLSCTLGAGLCRSFGVLVCDVDDPAGDLACNATLGLPETERCNALDDDCDGQTDEDWPDKGLLCTSGQGTCQATGVRSCDAGDPYGPTVCGAEPAEPAVEVCNGLDDDCNGQTDEAWPEKGTICSVGHGVCQATGVRVCAADDPAGPTLCTATPGQPEEEACDGFDNNCDGLTDEAWPDKNTVCFVGTGACQRGGVRVCSETDRLGPTVCDTVEGVPTAEVCNGVDDDCDGQTDEGWPEKGTVCTVGVGVCTATGVRGCDAANPGGATVCSANAGDGSTEVCDGLDNDCDGQTDEGWPDKGAICTVGAGLCKATGVRACDAAAPARPVLCGAVAGDPAPEVCNGLDDDCDGATDEAWLDKGTVCTLGVGACRRSGVRGCDAADPEGPTVCDAQAGAAEPEVCNGLDDDCDGATDEEPRWDDRGTVCTVGAGVCLASGVRLCDSVDPAGPTVCSAVAGTGSAEVCNGLDDDCDGASDEGAPWADKNTVCTVGTGACRASGIRVCDADAPDGPTRCDALEGVAVAETCNGQDDDCDGLTDEDWPTKGAPCSVGSGICAAGGVVICAPDDPQVAACTATPGEPLASELCNYLDDTCDGRTDEAFRDGAGRYVTPEACGNCFTDCTAIYALPQAFGDCDASPAVPRCRMGCVAGAFDLNAIPDDGCEFVLDVDAIYVSTTDPAATTEPECGRGPVGTDVGDVPCRTVRAGLERAVALGRSKVLVADGLYEEAVTLADGISLLGGYRSDTWERHLGSTLTTLRAPVGPGSAKTVVAAGLTRPTRFEGFVVQGQSAFTPGATSYAVWIADCGAALSVTSNLVQGGAGAAAPPAAGGVDGTAGVSGQAGQATIETIFSTQVECDAMFETPGNQGEAGDGGRCTCGADDVAGGDGGGAQCPLDNSRQPSGSAGLAADAGPGYAGGGGGGGYDRVSTTCGSFGTGGQSAQGLSGANGGEGLDGGPGEGCPEAFAAGAVEGNEWKGTPGTPGDSGSNGGGGGGGGAGGGADVTACDGSPDDCLGGSGGGGGSGGCAGAAGVGGGVGGGSFAVFVSFSAGGDSVPVVEGNTLVRGYGGAGGNGGAGGVGGLGGDGGDGGWVSGRWAFAMGQGGRGGQGGDAGHGGGGGGGCGGVAYALFVANASVTPDWHVTNTFSGGGTGGAGGAGGPSLGSSGSVGAAGSSGDWNY